MNKRHLMKVAVLASLAAMTTGGAAFAEEDFLAEYELAPMIVTAGRVPQKLVDARADISMVSRQEIEDMHMSNVEEALRTVPGVQFLNYGGNGLNANMSGVRINGSKDIVVLVDGVRINDFRGAGNGGYFNAPLLSNMDNIERIEVLRGSAATMYGSGAKGGVINIVTRKIAGTRTTIDLSTGQQGNENHKFSTMGRAGDDGKFSYLAYHNRLLSGDMKAGDGKVWPGHTHTESTGVKLAYDLAENNKASISYDEMKSDFSGEDFIYNNGFRGRNRDHSITFKHDVQFAENWDNSFTYRKNHNNDGYGQSYRNGQSYFNSTNMDYTLITEQLGFHDGTHSIIAGVDISKADNNDPKFAGFDENDNQVMVYHWYTNHSYFIQDDWNLMKGVTLSGGIRHDRPEADDRGPKFASHTSKSYKLSVDFTDNDTVYAGRSDFFILPGMDKLYNPKFGNGDLLPAYGRTSSIGYTHKFDDANALTFNWFKTEDEQSIGYEGDLNNGHYRNYNDGISRGWNAQYMGTIGENWSVNLGWAHLYQFTPGDTFSKGYYPKDKLTFDAIYTKDKWIAGVDGFYFIRKKDSMARKAVKGWPHDKYGIYNLSVNYLPEKNQTFYLKVNNIFNTLWAEHTNAIWGGGADSWYSMPGRVITWGYKLTF